MNHVCQTELGSFSPCVSIANIVNTWGPFRMPPVTLLGTGENDTYSELNYEDSKPHFSPNLPY